MLGLTVRADGQLQRSRSEVAGLLGQLQRFCGPGVGGFDPGLSRVALQRVADIVLGAAGGAPKVDRAAVAWLAQRERPVGHAAERADRAPSGQVALIPFVGEAMRSQPFERMIERSRKRVGSPVSAASRRATLSSHPRPCPRSFASSLARQPGSTCLGSCRRRSTSRLRCPGFHSQGAAARCRSAHRACNPAQQRARQASLAGDAHDRPRSNTPS